MTARGLAFGSVVLGNLFSSRSTSKQVITELTQRVHDYQSALGVPGDWGERTFRGWLVCEYLTGHRGWPCRTVVAGEVFDLLLLDSARVVPRIYIETKNPLNPNLTETHVRETHERCRRYGLGTLEWAYLTNGWHWRRYRVLSLPDGLEIEAAGEVSLMADGDEAIEELLGALTPR